MVNTSTFSFVLQGQARHYRHQYNGKAFVREEGIHWPQYKVIRWFTVQSYAELFQSKSIYFIGVR